MAPWPHTRSLGAGSFQQALGGRSRGRALRPLVNCWGSLRGQGCRLLHSHCGDVWQDLGDSQGLDRCSVSFCLLSVALQGTAS